LTLNFASLHYTNKAVVLHIQCVHTYSTQLVKKRYSVHTKFAMMMDAAAGITASDWFKGIFLSVLASIVGGASKLAIRKSWLLVNSQDVDGDDGGDDDNGGGDDGGDDDNGDDGGGDGGDNNDGGDENNVRPMRETQRLRCRNACRHESNGMEETEEDIEARRNKRLSNCLCYSGMLGMSVLNPLFCVLAMNYASPSILAPFSGLTLVWVILFSFPILGERPKTSQILAAGLIVTGEIIVAVFGDHTNDGDVTVEDVVSLEIRLMVFCALSCVTCAHPTNLLFALFSSENPILTLYSYLILESLWFTYS
jgi:hypothetical protein